MKHLPLPMECPTSSALSKADGAWATAKSPKRVAPLGRLRSQRRVSPPSRPSSFSTVRDDDGWEPWVPPQPAPDRGRDGAVQEGRRRWSRTQCPNISDRERILIRDTYMPAQDQRGVDDARR